MKISFQQDPKCERIIHIVQRKNLEGQETSLADIQEMLTGKRGNAGKHNSIYTAIRFLKKLGFIDIAKNLTDKRKKVIRLNLDKLTSRAIVDASIHFWKELEEFYKNNDDGFDSMFKVIKLLEQLKHGEFECKVCFHKSSFNIVDIQEVVGEGTLDSEKVEYNCENCGFRYMGVFYF